MEQRQNTDETLSEILRSAVKASGKTQYRLATDSKMGETQLARFMAGQGLRLDSAERLCKTLRLTLVSAHQSE